MFQIHDGCETVIEIIFIFIGLVMQFFDLKKKSTHFSKVSQIYTTNEDVRNGDRAL